MRAWLRALGDALFGVFAFPAHRGSSPAAIEERYRGVRRCC